MNNITYDTWKEVPVGKYVYGLTEDGKVNEVFRMLEDDYVYDFETNSEEHNNILYNRAATFHPLENLVDERIIFLSALTGSIVELRNAVRKIDWDHGPEFLENYDRNTRRVEDEDV